MATVVEIPELGESVTEAILVEWMKSDGDSVKTDDPICVIETDKADVELPSPASGILRTLKHDGDTIQVGEAIARIEESDSESPPTPVSEGAKPEAGEVEGPGEHVAADELSPAVRRLVTEHELDPALIKGTGRGGRLIKQDVLDYVESKKEEPPEEKQPPVEKIEVEKKPVPEEKSDTPFDDSGTRRVPMSRIRARIAERLVAAQQGAALLSTFNEVDMTNMMALRGRYKDRFQETHGVSLGLMSFFVRACVLALDAHPDVNASIEGKDIVYHQNVNMGIAVSTDRGLVVPVLRNTEAMSFSKIESEIKRVAGAAREGRLGLDELSGGTFTITNGGVFGSLLSTPILNPPQTGILGMHTIQKRPVAVGDRVEIRPMMYLALTYDHRLVDGRNSVTFLIRIKELIEDPARMMLGI